MFAHFRSLDYSAENELGFDISLQRPFKCIYHMYENCVYPIALVPGLIIKTRQASSLERESEAKVCQLWLPSSPSNAPPNVFKCTFQ